MFKKAEISDVDRILTFCKELREQDAKMSFTSFDTTEKIESLLKDESVFLYIAVDGDIITAMFQALRGHGNKEHSVYVACAVKEKYRKKNLATDLTNYGLADVKKYGVLIARTKIYSWNKPSIATIKKCGFEEGGRILMHQYEPSVGGYIDDLIFHKVL